MRKMVEHWVPDFDDIKLNTMIFVEQPYSKWNYSKSTYITSHEDVVEIISEIANEDLLRVVEVSKCRPRKVMVEHLKSAERFVIRVDQLLELHDNEMLTILPG